MKIAKNLYYVGQSGQVFNKKSVAIGNAMAVEMLHYGKYISMPLLVRIFKLDTDRATKVCSKILKDHTVGHLNTPFFSNWEARKEFGVEEVICQILGYTFSVSGNDLFVPSYMPHLLGNINFESFQMIDLATETKAMERFNELAACKVQLDRKQINNLAELAEYFVADPLELPRIYNSENRIVVLLELVKSIGLLAALDKLRCAPIDALRYAAGKKNIETVKLPADVIYANLTWQERVQLLTFLNSFSYGTLFEATGMNREAWTRFYRHIHLFGQPKFVNRFPTFGLVSRIAMGAKLETIPNAYVDNLQTAIDTGVVELTNSNNLAYRTFASRVQSAIDDCNFPAIEKLMRQSSGYLLRNLATVANGITANNIIPFLALVREQIPDAPVGVLFSILGINVNAEYRIIDIKGNSVVEKACYPAFIADIQGDIRRAIKTRYGMDSKLVVDESIKNLVVPFLSKNTELDRGSRIAVGGKRYLYMFVHWVENRQRTDLDLSVVTFDKAWKPNVVYFGSQVNSYITHSGDITSAPAPCGATEYVRIDFDAVPLGAKYIAPMVNVFCGENFQECETAYAGFLLTDSPKFEITDDHIRYDLKEPANSNIPFVFDTVSKEIVILDFNNRHRGGATAFSELENMKNVITAASTKNVVTIGVLGELLSGDGETKLHVVKHKNPLAFDEIEAADLFSIFS